MTYLVKYILGYKLPGGFRAWSRGSRILLVVGSLTWGGGLLGQETQGQLLGQDLRHFFEQGNRLLHVPLELGSEDLPRISGIVLRTGLLMLADDPVRGFVLDHRSPLGRRISAIDGIQGNAGSLVPGLLAYSAGWMLEREQLRVTGLLATEAFFYAGGVTAGLKILFGRERPYADQGPWRFEPLQHLDSQFHAFPSGHTTVAFAVSTVLAGARPEWWWRGFWYGNAGLVGLARIYHDRHWTSDVFLAALVGHGVARFLLRAENPAPGSSHWEVRPVVGPGFAGLETVWKE